MADERVAMLLATAMYESEFAEYGYFGMVECEKFVEPLVPVVEQLIADACSKTGSNVEQLGAVERLTPEQYDRLNAAVEDDLPRTTVGEVALEIVNEYLAGHRG